MKQIPVVLGLMLVLSGVQPCAAKSIAATMQARGEGETAAIGYTSVVEARDALTGKDDAVTRDGKAGWVEIEDRSENVLWSFAPEGHPAYPSVIRRTVAGVGPSIRTDMDAICEAGRADCEALMREMVKMNEAARTRFLRSSPKGGGNARPVPVWGYLSGGRAQ